MWKKSNVNYMNIIIVTLLTKKLNRKYDFDRIFLKYLKFQEYK